MNTLVLMLTVVVISKFGLHKKISSANLLLSVLGLGGLHHCVYFSAFDVCR